MLSAKTVRHIAGVVSSAFGRAERWGLVTSNPVTRSEPPIPKKHRGIALTPAQQALVFESASGPWWMATLKYPPQSGPAEARSWHCAGRIFKMAAQSSPDRSAKRGRDWNSKVRKRIGPEM